MNLDHLRPLAREFFSSLDTDAFLVEHQPLLERRAERLGRLLQEDRIPSLSVDEIKEILLDTDTILGLRVRLDAAMENILGKENEHAERIREWFADLVRTAEWGLSPGEFNRLCKSVNWIGPSFTAEFLMHRFPNRYWIWNGPIQQFVARMLGEGAVKGMLPPGKKSDKGEEYFAAGKIIQEIRDVMAAETSDYPDFITVDLFMYWGKDRLSQKDVSASLFHFTWRPIYMEIAHKLLEYEHRQEELVALLERLREKGCAIISLQDRDGEGTAIPLTVIDPFTFYAGFNRGISNANRREVLRALKEEWKLRSPVPDDFDGVPIINNMNVLYFASAAERGENDIATLWRFAREIITRVPAQVDHALFNEALNIPYVGMGKLTMGMFWMRPETYFAADRKNREYVKSKGVIGDPKDAASYFSFLERVEQTLGDDFADISYQAHLYVLGNEEGLHGKPELSSQQLQTGLVTGELHESEVAYSSSAFPERAPRIWLLATGLKGSEWKSFLADGSAQIDYPGMGDLQAYGSRQEMGEALSDLLHDGKKNPFHDSLACWQFLHEISIGDIIVAKAGISTLLGYGVVTGPYEYEGKDLSTSFSHRRSVDWKKTGNWAITRDQKLVTKTLTDITKDRDLVDYIESLLEEEFVATSPPPPPQPPVQPVLSIEKLAATLFVEPPTIEQWKTAITRKGQMIFYGPPGTGKTFAAREFARYLIGGGRGFMQVVQFHPSYSYEDFIQGIRPVTGEDGTLSYRVLPGVFKTFCEKAAALGPDNICVLILDEINRANLSRVFGELMYLLEYRGESVRLAGDGNEFHIPKNVRIIGTMNTADRSIALVDHALRRRFAFIELRPDYNLLRSWHEQQKSGFNTEGLIATLRRLNSTINDPHYEVGTSFFLLGDLAEQIEHVWRMEIEPYLGEYFFDRPERARDFSWKNIEEGIRQ